MTTIQSMTTGITSLYERDFYLWLQTNINLLKEGKFSEIDLENLLEELESMGRSDKNALKSNPAPNPLEIVPPPPLTPEQSLIAGIQNQIAEITDRLGGGLVKSFEANFSSSILTVKLAEDWYLLSELEQNQLVTKMFKEANLLDFSKLEVLNLEGQLIARSPVIGSEMIILDRTGN
jgi:Domain of unknown function DUF29.